MKGGCVYIITNKYHTVFYTGVTSDLVSRIIEHKEKLYPKSFFPKYNCNKLVYFKFFESIEAAIKKEKYIKGKVRSFKEHLILSQNPDFKDLWKKLRTGKR